MKACEELRKEHNAVGLGLKILSIIRKKIEQGEAVDIADLQGMLEFLDVFVDKCHFSKEEELLIPLLKTKEGVENGFLEMILNEHANGREYIGEYKEAVRGLGGDGKAEEKIIKAINSITYFLIDHAGKEDSQLFAWADTFLDDAEQAALLEKFEILEEERTGPGKHEELHQYLHEMKKKYLAEKGS